MDYQKTDIGLKAQLEEMAKTPVEEYVVGERIDVSKNTLTEEDFDRLIRRLYDKPSRTHCYILDWSDIEIIPAKNSKYLKRRRAKFVKRKLNRARARVRRENRKSHQAVNSLTGEDIAEAWKPSLSKNQLTVF